jgi:hypothetical protein
VNNKTADNSVVWLSGLLGLGLGRECAQFDDRSWPAYGEPVHNRELEKSQDPLIRISSLVSNELVLRWATIDSLLYPLNFQSIVQRHALD